MHYVVAYDAVADFISPAMSVIVSSPVTQVGSDESDLNVYIIRATVKVTNKVQSIKTAIEGVDEVRKISTTCSTILGPAFE